MYRLTSDTSIVRLAEGAVIPADARNRDFQDYLAWVAAGNAAEPYLPPPEPRRLVAKRVVVDRLDDAGKLVAARAALDAAPLAVRERWNARDAIYADDASALALLSAIGADPTVILAP